MEKKDLFQPTYPAPTSNRPFLGLTVLVIEDSRYACEAMRLLCLRSGARIRRADTLRAARRHLQVYRPSVALVDLGLPDGNGADLIRDFAESPHRPEIVLGISGNTGAEAEVMAAGADGFMAKPITSLAHFQETILSYLPKERHPLGPRALPEETVTPDPLAYRDDMAHVANLLEEKHEDRVVDYVTQFLSGVARSAEDRELINAVDELASQRQQGKATLSEIARVAGLIQERIVEQGAI